MTASDYWQYKGLIEFMSLNPATYGLDNQRAELHKKIENSFQGKKEDLKYVLHNLPVDYMYEDFLWAINNIVDFKKALEGKDAKHT